MISENARFLPGADSFDVILPHNDGWVCFDIRFPFAVGMGKNEFAALERKEKCVKAAQVYQVAVWPAEKEGWCCRSMVPELSHATAQGETQHAAFCALMIHLGVPLPIPAEPANAC